MSKKRIKRLKGVKGKRITYIVPDTVPDTQKRPLFSFHYLQDAYCISRCTREEKAGFADTMRTLSKLTWNEIRLAPRHGLGSEKIERNSIRASIPSNITDDATFLAIRFHRMKPMVGFRESNIFHIVWFDKSLSLYDHGN